MAKPIKITAEHIEAIKTEFNEMLKKAKLCDGKISFTKNLTNLNRKARVFFTELAWFKMITLIEGCSQEVAWHATARRLAYEGDNPTNDYLIGDIMVYPQKVTSATVEMDEQEYAKWLMANCEDERFYEIHCQMHSHVNMGVTPSVTDLAHQEEIVSQLNGDNFYIFMIWNKRHEANIKIYDLKENIMFESSDITWLVLDGDYGMQKFLADSKALVKQKVYTPTTYGSPYNPTGYGAGSYTAPASGSNIVNLPAANAQSGVDKGKKDKKDKKKDKKKTKYEKAPGDGFLDPTFCDANGVPYDMTDAFMSVEGPLYTN